MRLVIRISMDDADIKDSPRRALGGILQDISRKFIYSEKAIEPGLEIQIFDVNGNLVGSAVVEDGE